MRKLEVTITEEQYQHIQAEIKYAARTHLSEGIFGGYELCLQVGIPDVFGAHLEMKINNTIDLGEVEWRFSLTNKSSGK
ncbi:hypothetical protein [Salinimicrobium gaetbulicola]|uniref:Uncharacterized protein n=1 Tax=Salinimicrobium gaetbulicola TaxID=999702 RepID=A0ABW3IEV4_9FLAO